MQTGTFMGYYTTSALKDCPSKPWFYQKVELRQRKKKSDNMKKKNLQVFNKYTRYVLGKQKTSTFECKTCQETFKSKHGFEQHFLSRHDMRTYQFNYLLVIQILFSIKRSVYLFNTLKMDHSKRGGLEDHLCRFHQLKLYYISFFLATFYWIK